MSSKRPAVSAEDQALFLEAVGGTRPLAGRDRIPVAPARTAVARVVELPPEVKLTVEGDSQRFVARAPGVSRAQGAQLQAGKLHVERTLDLHGERVEPALGQLRAFLVEAGRIGHRVVLVIHGKGTHSEHGAPLREAVLSELLGPLSGLVSAFASAAPAHGGEGASYVLLRGRP